MATGVVSDNKNHKPDKMEPITTTAMAGAVVGYLAQKLKENKPVQDFFGSFTEATVSWIKPLFIADDGKPKEIIQDLQSDPEDKLNTDAVENAIAKAVKKDPAIEANLQAMYEALQQKAAKGETISIINSTNVVTGTMKAKGPIIVGNNNTTNSSPK